MLQVRSHPLWKNPWYTWTLLSTNPQPTFACRKNFGPKGYGFGGGAGTLSMDDGQGYKTNPNGVDHQARAYVAPKKPLVPNTSSNVAGGSRARQ